MRSLFPLLLIAALALVSTVAAVNEDFQNGPGTWIVQASGNPVETHAFVAYPDAFYTGSTTLINPINSIGVESNYVGFTTVRDGESVGSKNVNVKLQARDQSYNLIRAKDATLFYNITSADYDPYSIRIRGQRVGSTLNIYAGDTLIATDSPYNSNPFYWAFESGSSGKLDDFSLGQSTNNIVGIMPVDWYLARDMIEPSLSGMYNGAGGNIPTTVMYASYAVDATPAGAYISIDGDHQRTALDEWADITVRNNGGTWEPLKKHSGLVGFDLAEFMAEKPYGRHTVVLETSDGKTIEQEFWYIGQAAIENTITFDHDEYAPQDEVGINSTISDDYYLPGQYSYYGALYDATTGLFKGTNWTIPSQIFEQTTSVTTDLFPATGEYYALLYAVESSSGTHILLDQDICQVYANKIIFSGTVWDAQQGTILAGATVSVTQGGTTTTDTTGSDGRFEIGGLSKDVYTTLSAAKTGYNTAWSNTTPNEYRRYEFDLALSPSAPAHSGEAVFGTVRSYPSGSFVASPTVAILKDGVQVNTTTATAKGWYIFDGLDASTTYTVEVEADGYVDYSNAVVTGSGGASLTQLDPWLIPYYDLTVHLKDAVSMQPITALMAVSIGGQSKQTSTGTAVFNNVQMGAASVAVVGSGYESNETGISMAGDQEITLYIMPLAVVPTTDIPLTPTPTPALVGMIGTVYDGMTGTAITGATVEVTAEQGDVARTDITDGAGDYSIVNIQNGVLTTVNATAAGYTHTAFSFTPAGSAEYIVDLYMYRTDESTNPTIEPDPGLAGAGGTVLGGPYHELIESPTVTASNGTWSGPATLSPDHVWYFTDLAPNTAYTFTASASGYITRTVEATMGAAGSFTVVPIVLDGVYDVTITVKDADTYALILQPVQLTLSNGQTGNTSTGSYTFANLEYATYVVSAASEDYTGGGLSFLAYGDHTEYLYLAKAPEGSDSTYEYAIPPKPVEILCRSIFGMPLAGVTVTAQGGETTLPDEDLLGAFFGWGEKYSGTNLANASMTGTTSSDGGITFMMTDALKYNLTFSDPARGISETVELMPHDTQYMFVLGSTSATPAAGMPNMTLWADGAEGASPTLCGYYSDPVGTTSALYFVVERINGTVREEVNNKSLGAVQTASPSFAVNHTTGAMYSWGFRATTPDRGALQQWNGITLHSRLVPLPIEESSYFWVSMCLVFLFAGLFSGNNIKYGFVAFPMFCGVLWYIGWLNIAGMTLGIVMVLGVLMYLAKVQVA